MGTQWRDGYSALAEALLIVDGESYRVERMGRNSIKLRDHCQCAPNTKATLVIKIDDWEKRQEIVLREGVTRDDEPSFSFA